MTQPFLNQPINFDAGMPRYRQIYQRIKNAIHDGVLKANDRLPSARALAKEWAVARGTAEEAYQQLKDEGYILAKGPRGCFVHPQVKERKSAYNKPLQAASDANPARWEHAELLPFQMGLPALDAFPRGPWQRMTQRILREMPQTTYRNTSRTGLAELKVSIAQYLSVSRGFNCLPDQVIITGGYRHTLSLIAHALGGEGKAWVEDPGYPPTRQLLQALGFTPVAIPVDEQGMDIDAAYQQAGDAKMAVVTPAHQSPLCCTLSLKRRQALLAWAREANAFVVEDDYDGEYRMAGRPLPALKHLDQDDRVLYMGTFSKVLMPSLRLAYLVVPRAQITRFSHVFSNLYDSQPTLSQKQVAQFIAEGRFARHIEAMRRLYKQRRELTVKGLLAVLGDYLTIDAAPGGMHIIARPNAVNGERINDCELAQRCINAGLYANPLSTWYTSQPQQGLLMSYTNVSNPQVLHEYAHLMKAKVFGTY